MLLCIEILDERGRKENAAFKKVKCDSTVAWHVGSDQFCQCGRTKRRVRQSLLPNGREKLCIEGNKLTVLDVNRNTALEQLPALDVGEDGRLLVLYCGRNF